MNYQDLTTEAKVKDFLAVGHSTHDSLIGDLISRASNLIQTYCGRPLKQVSTFAYNFIGDGTKKQYVPYTHVTYLSGALGYLADEDDITSWANLDDSKYYARALGHSEYGLWYIYNADGFTEGAQYRFNMSPGPSTVNPAIEQICIEACAELWQFSRQGDEGSRLGVSSRSSKEINTQVVSFYQLNERHKELLEPFRVKAVA